MTPENEEVENTDASCQFGGKNLKKKKAFPRSRQKQDCGLAASGGRTIFIFRFFPFSIWRGGSGTRLGSSVGQDLGAWQILDALGPWASHQGEIV